MDDANYNDDNAMDDGDEDDEDVDVGYDDETGSEDSSHTVPEDEVDEAAITADIDGHAEEWDDVDEDMEEVDEDDIDDEDEDEEIDMDEEGEEGEMIWEVRAGHVIMHWLR